MGAPFHQPVPRALPFLSLGSTWLVAPWRKARELSAKQAGELRQVARGLQGDCRGMSHAGA